MTHYDNYGDPNRRVFEAAGAGPHLDLTLKNGEHRYLLWVTDDWRGTSYTGQHKTYRTEVAAVRRAKRLARRGLGVQVVDREIRPGDSGFLADRSGSYLCDEDGTLHIGTFDEIQALRAKRSAHEEEEAEMTTKTFRQRTTERAAALAAVHVKRQDISVYEELRPVLTNGFERMYWVASLDGRISTGEDVQMSATGDTAKNAIAALEGKIAEQGWEIR